MFDSVNGASVQRTVGDKALTERASAGTNARNSSGSGGGRAEMHMCIWAPNL